MWINMSWNVTFECFRYTSTPQSIIPTLSSKSTSTANTVIRGDDVCYYITNTYTIELKTEAIGAVPIARWE